ncbi:MAG: RNA-guided endonuclease InsQ/TnpB family protein [Xenococcaceae cyanobacterium]
MIIYESKLEGEQNQYEKLDAAIRTGRFVRNSIISAWQDNLIKSRNDAYKYCKTLADNPEFPWAKWLNSQARQAHAERAWAAVERFYRSGKAKVQGKKGYPKFKKYQVRDSVEYKVSGWKISFDRRYLTFTDGFSAGTFKLWGSRNLHYYQLEQIKRVRVVRRHDGYYAQFIIDYKREENKELTGRQIGLDVGLNNFYTDSKGEKVDNPRFLRQDERAIKKLQRRLSKTFKGSKNRAKVRNKLGRAHLKVSRRRNDWVCKLAQRVIQSNDLVAIENLKVRSMIKNHCLAKSIADAAWYRFREWLEYFSVVYGVPVIAVNPKYTSQNCSNCGQLVVKTLSTRTHRCPHCGYVADRDENAARNILKEALKELSARTSTCRGNLDSQSSTVGHTECQVSGEIPLCLDVEIQPNKGTRAKEKS